MALLRIYGILHSERVYLAPLMPGIYNAKTDVASCEFTDTHEWILSPRILAELTRTLGYQRKTLLERYIRSLYRPI